jgi:hypothetical protein
MLDARQCHPDKAPKAHVEKSVVHRTANKVQIVPCRSTRDRASVGLLIVLWGIDKIVIRRIDTVSDAFYGGLLTMPSLMRTFGVAQALVGRLFMVGLLRRVVDPVVLLLNTASMLGVWRWIVDPWGCHLQNTNVLFSPSLMNFAASTLVLVRRDEETLVLDRGDRP